MIDVHIKFIEVPDKPGTVDVELMDLKTECSPAEWEACEKFIIAVDQYLDSLGASSSGPLQMMARLINKRE